jgi:CRISPR-associated protein Csx14
MKTSVIAPLGLSPPVITAFIEHIGEISDVVILTTENEKIKHGFELIRIGSKLKYPRVRIHEVKLPFEDVYTTEQNLQFMAIAAKTIKDERETHKCDRVLLNIAGGRKNMCITLTLLGQILGVDGVYHVITKDVAIVNQRLESLREEIKRIYEARNDEEKVKVYREKERYFNGLLFPSKYEYEVVRIPTLPYPSSYLRKKELLYRHGLLNKIGKRYVVSDYGKKFVEVLIHPKP